MGVTEESFKNVYISDGGRGITLYERTPGGGMGTRLDTFKTDEYDVTISFRRKPRPFMKGDSVEVVGETSGLYTVRALYLDPAGWANGSWAWIHNESRKAPRTIPLCNLRHADPI